MYTIRLILFCARTYIRTHARMAGRTNARAHTRGCYSDDDLTEEVVPAVQELLLLLPFG